MKIDDAWIGAKVIYIPDHARTPNGAVDERKYDQLQHGKITSIRRAGDVIGYSGSREIRQGKDVVFVHFDHHEEDTSPGCYPDNLELQAGLDIGYNDEGRLQVPLSQFMEKKPGPGTFPWDKPAVIAKMDLAEARGYQDENDDRKVLERLLADALRDYTKKDEDPGDAAHDVWCTIRENMDLVKRVLEEE